MITIKRLSNGKLECCLDLTGTKAENFAPFSGSKETDRQAKYVLGYGDHPISALKNAYEILGEQASRLVE